MIILNLCYSDIWYQYLLFIYLLLILLTKAYKHIFEGLKIYVLENHLIERKCMGNGIQQR